MEDNYRGFFEEDDDLGDAIGGEATDSEWNYFNANADAEIDNDIIDEINFSEMRGKSFGSSLNKFNHAYHNKNRRKIIENSAGGNYTKNFGVTSSAKLIGKNKSPKNVSRVIVPDDQKIIVQGVDNFILDKGNSCEGEKNIGYYNCKKLKELVISMTNTSLVDFNLELFNPSMPMDYLFSTSGNINNKVIVAGGVVSYSDVLFNMLANPLHIVNAKFAYTSASAALTAAQINQPLMFKNKRITGDIKIAPLNTQLQIDVYQHQSDILFFDFDSSLGRPFMPDGMDVIQYKVLAGCSVTFSFYYRQKSLKRFFLKEARTHKIF